MKYVKSLNMNEKMFILFHDLEMKRKSLFDRLDAADLDLLTFKPDHRSWSILQVCHHLIVSEELSLRYLNKKLKYKSEIPDAGIRSSLRSFSLNLVLRLPFRLSAPQRVSEFPENLDWVELKNRWVNVRNGMKERLETVPEEINDKLIYKHPSAGRLTLYQMLTFFRTHIERHEDQILKLIKSGRNLEWRNS